MDQTATSVADAFLAGWVARFGTPTAITCDQGRNFESDLFRSLAKLLGCNKSRTTAYNPCSNEIIERFHRQLKTSLKCRLSDRWVEQLPLILLGLKSALKEDLGSSSAELVYGSTLRLPGEFFSTFSGSQVAPPEFLASLRQKFQDLRSIPASHHSSK